MSDAFNARQAQPLETLFAQLADTAPLDLAEGGLRRMGFTPPANEIPRDAALFFFAMASQEQGRAALEWLADVTIRNFDFPGGTLEARAMNDVRHECMKSFMALIGRAVRQGQQIYEGTA